jgi:hypothetical protein
MRSLSLVLFTRKNHPIYDPAFFAVSFSGRGGISARLAFGILNSLGSASEKLRCPEPALDGWSLASPHN